MINDKNSVICKLKKQARFNNLRPRTQDAVNFYIKTIKKLRTPMRKSPGFMKDESLIERGMLKKGMLVYYEYDAITENLPFWDAYPLTLVIAVWTDKNGKTYFDGVNFHYLPPFMKYTLMIKLLDHTNGNINLKNTKINIDYEMFKSPAILGQFIPAYKKYLLSQVRSNFYQVELKDMDIAINLPLAVWQNGATDKSVWSDSIAKSIRAMKR